MVSMMITLFVVGALITLYVERQTEHVRLERGEQIGSAMATLGAGFTAYLGENYKELINDQPKINGFSNPLRPTAKQLIDELNIRGVSDVPPVIPGASYQFQVSFKPGCTARQKHSEVRCRPIGLAYIDKPLVRGKSGVDYVALARAARVMKGRGGYSLPESSSTFTFPDSVASAAVLPINNPTGVAGILAWKADALSQKEERLKTNGSNRMKNSLRLDGDNVDHDLLGVKDIGASGNVMTAGRLHVKGGVPGSTWGVTVDKDALVEGDFQVNGEARTDRLTVAQQTHTDTLYLGKSNNPGEPCSRIWATGQDARGNWVQCRDNRWQSMTAENSPEIIIFDTISKTRYNDRVILGHWLYCGPWNDISHPKITLRRWPQGAWVIFDNRDRGEKDRSSGKYYCFGRMANFDGYPTFTFDKLP